jgi:DNA-binding IclR family transcriptional regulator
MTKSAAYPGTQAILRAVALLKAFTDAEPEWGLAGLARAAGLNKTTTYRLLTALESEGLGRAHPAVTGSVQRLLRSAGERCAQTICTPRATLNWRSW